MILQANHPSQQRVILNVDASQVEDRIVARLCTALMGKPCKKDLLFLEGRKAHPFVASIIYGIDEKKVKKDNTPGSQYYTAKKVVHANNYDMGDDKCAIIIKKSIQETKRIRKIVHTIFPEIKDVYHPWVQAELRKDRTLINAYGRPHPFLDRWDENLFRRGYAYYPQSSNGDLCELAYADFFYEKLDYWEADLLLTTHDSITCQILPCSYCIMEAKSLLESYISRPMKILTQELIVPSEFTLGRSYRGQYGFKTREDVCRLLRKLRYPYEEVERLHSGLHDIYGGSRISGGLSLLDRDVDYGRGDPPQRLSRQGLLQAVSQSLRDIRGGEREAEKVNGAGVRSGSSAEEDPGDETVHGADDDGGDIAADG